MTPHEWILSNDTGTSSKTIWAVIMNAIPTKPTPFQFDIPHDPSDFGRCYRLLTLIPEWRSRLSEVAEIFPIWKPMVREWDKMEELYKRDFGLGKSEELYNLMQDLRHEGMIEDEWKQTSPGSWERQAPKRHQDA